MKSTKQLREDLDAALMGYIKEFEIRHGVELEYAVDDGLMGVLRFGDNFFSIKNIIYDVDNKLPIRLIFEWQEAGVDAHIAGIEAKINLRSYASGLRYGNQNG